MQVSVNFLVVNQDHAPSIGDDARRISIEKLEVLALQDSATKQRVKPSKLATIKLAVD